ncbi:MAG: ESPR-type extended signal peptide-containing protein [Dialister micraerophilus]|uniref:ESPR-type extended signal peptide-containing protein n=1 Tax=Dialister micraerophilus TaxID=309120 RepID=UPI002551553D|nr:ESPR-type extended signal peptide-containing protein [Dialister micraerophilus]MDK8253169.1 ESPR-type extended signal peptide-containing protein [Dialister micraerophilus]
MNRIFKTVWSRTKNMYVVVSEITNSCGKSKSGNVIDIKAAFAAVLILTSSVPFGIHAALTQDQQAVYDAVMQQLAQTSGKAALGKVRVDNDKETLSLGHVQLDGKNGNLYLGTKAAGNEVGISQTQYTQGISGSNIAWGSGNVAGLALEAQTKEATVDGKKTNIITGYKRTRQADGFMIPLWNINSSGVARSYSTAIGFLNAAYGVGAFSVGQYSAAGADSAFAGGYDAIASAKQAFAFGKKVKAMGENSVAMGEKSEAWAKNSFALGDTAKAQDVGAIAMGNNAVASGKSSFAAGVKSKAKAYSTIALGDNAEAEGNYSVAMGHNSKATEENSSAVGAWANAKGQYSSALGTASEALGFLSTAVGGGKVEETGDRGLSMGYGAQTTVADGVSVGSNSVASRSGNVYGYNVLGGNAYDTESIGAVYGQGKKEEIEGYNRSIAEKQPQLEAAEAAYNKAKQDLDDMFHGRPGALEFNSANQAKLEAEIERTKQVYENLEKEFNEIKVKRNKLTGAYLSSSAAVSVGNEETGMTRQITGVAAGTKDTDAVNVAQLKALNKKVDKSGVHYFSVNSDDKNAPDGTNWKNDGATGQDAVAIGKNAEASGKSAFATGWKSKAAGYSDIAIGREAEATGGWGVAIGQSAKAQASTAVAMAYDAKAKGANSLAIGVQSEARTNDSIAYGRGAKALGDVALAVGTLTKAEGNHSSVFGFEATTDSTAWNGTAIGRGAYIGKQAPDGTKPDIGVSDNYYTPVDDDTVAEAGKETKNSTAVGFGAKSFGYQNTAIGAGAEAFDTNTVAVGVLSKAIGNYANALGKQARAEGKDSTAIGHFARAIGESSTVLGDYAITSTLDGKKGVSKSVAIGSHARAASDNSIALGNNSLANIADDVKTEAYLSKENFKKENGVVSVGNKEYTVGNEKIEQNYRRIINVAGGADDHDAVNVAQLKALANAPMNFYFGGKVENNIYTPGGTNWSTPLNEFRMDFGDGLKAEQVTDKDGKKYTRVTLDKDSLKNDPAFKGEKGADGANGKSAYEIWKAKSGNESKSEDEFLKSLKGADGAKGADGTNGKSAYELWKAKSGNESKSEEDFFNSLKGKEGKNGTNGTNGTNGKDGTNGKSAYQLWKEQQNSDGSKPNEKKSEKEFFDSLKGKDGAKGKDGKNGTNGTNGKDGTNGTNGKSAYDIWLETQTDKTKTKQDFLNSLKGKDGKDGTNGVTVEKVKEITNKIKTEFKNEITKKMNEFKTESVRGDALGAALSALKPLDYDPYHRSQIMAGVSLYKGQEAIALGLAYYSNENTLLHAGLSYAGSSELMANAGISYRFGSSYDRKLLSERNKLMPQYKDGVISSVYVMQDEMTKLQKENEILKEKNAKAEAENKEMRSELEILKKQVSKLMEKI